MLKAQLSGKSRREQRRYRIFLICSERRPRGMSGKGTDILERVEVCFPKTMPSPQHTTPTLPLPGKKAGRVKKNKQGVRAEAGIYPEHIVDQYISIKCHMTNQRLTQYLFQPLIPCFSKLQRLEFKYKIPKLSCSRGWQ